MQIATAKDKAKKILEFEKKCVCVNRNCDRATNIVVKSFWTVRGRKKILRDIRRRLRHMLEGKGYNLSYQITLTYSDFSRYNKGDIKSFLNSFFQIFRKKRIDFKYFWVAEIQKRGMIHYHILVFVRSRDRIKFFKYFQKERIDALWQRGYTFITVSSKTLRKAYNYATKYLVKTIKSQDDFYLELVAFFRDSFGRFRLYGMSQVRRFARGVRKKLICQYQKYPTLYSELQKTFQNLPENLKQHIYAPWGWWVKRVGKVIVRYSDWSPPLWFLRPIFPEAQILSERLVDEINTFDLLDEEEKEVLEFVLQDF